MTRSNHEHFIISQSPDLITWIENMSIYNMNILGTWANFLILKWLHLLVAICFSNLNMTMILISHAGLTSIWKGMTYTIILISSVDGSFEQHKEIILILYTHFAKREWYKSPGATFRAKRIWVVIEEVASVRPLPLPPLPHLLNHAL